MKILTVYVGTGTQDIFLYDSQLDIENGFKLVVPSPTMIVHRQVKAANDSGSHPAHGRDDGRGSLRPGLWMRMRVPGFLCMPPPKPQKRWMTNWTKYGRAVSKLSRTMKPLSYRTLSSASNSWTSTCQLSKGLYHPLA